MFQTSGLMLCSHCGTFLCANPRPFPSGLSACCVFFSSYFKLSWPYRREFNIMPYTLWFLLVSRQKILLYFMALDLWIVMLEFFFVTWASCRKCLLALRILIFALLSVCIWPLPVTWVLLSPLGIPIWWSSPKWMILVCAGLSSLCLCVREMYSIALTIDFKLFWCTSRLLAFGCMDGACWKYRPKYCCFWWGCLFSAWQTLLRRRLRLWLLNFCLIVIRAAYWCCLLLMTIIMKSQKQLVFSINLSF